MEFPISTAAAKIRSQPSREIRVCTESIPLSFFLFLSLSSSFFLSRTLLPPLFLLLSLVLQEALPREFSRVRRRIRR